MSTNLVGKFGGECRNAGSLAVDETFVTKIIAVDWVLDIGDAVFLTASFGCS